MTVLKKIVPKTPMPVSGSHAVSETGNVRRRSARLSKKAEENGSIIIENNSPVSHEIDVMSLEAKASDFEINQSMVADKDEENVGSRNGKQKRKLSAEIAFLNQGLGGIDALEKGIMNLRSGKRVLKRKMEEDKDCYDDIVIVENESDKDENDGCENRRFSRDDKGKGKVVYEESGMNGSDLDIEVVDDRVTFTCSDTNSDSPELLRSSARNPLVVDEGLVGVESRRRDIRRFSEEEKGKRKVGDDDSSPNHKEPNADANSTVPNQPVASTEPRGNIRIGDTEVAAYYASMVAYRERVRANQKQRCKGIARQLASSFARFSSQDELQLGNRVNDLSALEIPPPEPEVWPGRFATALKIIKDRELDRNGEQVSASTNKSADMKWIPSKQEQGRRTKGVSPSLQDLCLSVLSENADSITSLDFVPDMLRHKICWALCDRRRMNSYFLQLLLHGSPSEIRIRDCSWLSEEVFVKAFEGCNTDKLTVLQFDLAGRCLPDYTLSSTLTRSPNSLVALTTLSLKGAYRLTDEGLRMLMSSAPNFKSVNLSECSLLTSKGVCCLVDSLRLGLRELYLDACHGVDANLILSVLLKLESLEVLSLAGIHTVSDDFVSKLVSVHGCRMKEIVLADCMELTDSSLKAIGDNCPGLHVLDLANLRKLTDVGICLLANGCREIQMLKFCRSQLSDEAIAAYLDIRGTSLKELSLNNLIKVSNNTAQSLARNCKNLQNLDLSWCRNLTDEALGLIVDNCSSLELVKLFGCTQVTSVFLDGYSNPRVKLVGLKLMSVIQHIDVPDFLQGPLRYSSPV